MPSSLRRNQSAMSVDVAVQRKHRAWQLRIEQQRVVERAQGPAVAHDHLTGDGFEAGKKCCIDLSATSRLAAGSMPKAWNCCRFSICARVLNHQDLDAVDLHRRHRAPGAVQSADHGAAADAVAVGTQ